MGTYNVHGGHNRIVPGAGHYLDEVTEDRRNHGWCDCVTTGIRTYSLQLY